MYSNVMLDLETLGTRPDAAILSIGAIAFNLHDNLTQYFEVKCGADLTKYSVDYATFKFWMERPDDARNALFTEVVPLADGLRGLANWIRYSCGNDSSPNIWAMPSKFDLPILENAFKVENVPVPWKYDSDACLRTLCKLAKITKAQRVQPRIPHDALSDCEAQLATLRLALQWLANSYPRVESFVSEPQL